MFSNKKIASDMRWHKEKRISEDDVLRHPADSEAWKDFDIQFPSFAEDPRNVRLGLATDGFNPYGNLSNAYSIWPVMLIPYNLPPWDCMKDPFIFMSLLIPGPKSPGKDIDVYLQPLVEELKTLWHEGILTYDAASGRTFSLHAAVMWTVNDFPAYGDISGWVTKGYKACPICKDDVTSTGLRGKQCFMGHRRFLPTDHKWRRSLKFDGKHERRPAPLQLSGEEVMAQLCALPSVWYGKDPARKKRKRDASLGQWSRMCILWELPYWEKLKLPHNLDVMHIEKNITESVIGTLMNIEGRTKDTIKARLDLEDMGIRKELHVIREGDRMKKPYACYTLTQKEKIEFCEFLKSVKFPDAYAANISRCVKVKEAKILGLKTHDYHVLLQRLLPIGLRGLLNDNVYGALNELGGFFREISSRTLHVESLKALEK